MTITKAELAERLHEEIGLNKREARDFVDDFFEIIKEALEDGENVKLSGFGQFSIRHKTARPGRNPKTGVEVPISERRVVTFKQSQSLKEGLEEQTETLEARLGKD